MGMDLAVSISRIYPGAEYLLSSSVPPHTIVEWRGAVDMPSQDELETAWNEYLEEERIKEEEKAEILSKGVLHQMLVNDQVFDAVLLLK